MKNYVPLIFFIPLFFCMPASAEAAGDMLAYTTDVLKASNDRLSELRNNYRIQVGMVILVGVLGALTALLQAINASFVKKATVAIGFVISAMTVVVNTLEMNNYKQTGFTIAKAQIALDKMTRAQLVYTRYPAPGNEIGLEDFQKHHKTFITLTEPEESPNNVSQQKTTFFPSAYAGETEPKWLRELPGNTNSLYFVGVADSPNLRDAQAEANENAKAVASQFLRGAIDSSVKSTEATKALGDDVASTANEVDNYISLDEKTGSYRYYSLVRLNKLQAQTDAKFQLIKSGVNIQSTSLNSITALNRDDTAYQEKRLSLQVQQINQVNASLSAEQRKNFSDARQARRAGDQRKAIALLNQLTEDSPEFYMGWFNLALAYSKDKQEQNAHQAYEKAVALEPKQPTRDSSIYNSFGHFLLERNEYCDSEKLLNKAITVDPENTIAQRNLLKTTSIISEKNITCL